MKMLKCFRSIFEKSNQNSINANFMCCVSSSTVEQAKFRPEITTETMRKETRRESQQHDDELGQVCGSTYHKIKALECQLENEYEERTLLLREKHELERRLKMVEEQNRVDRAAEEATNQKLKRDLRKYKALHKDAQAQLERLKADSPGKLLVRQLRNQLEDVESARSIAVKARQTAEGELSEQVDELLMHLENVESISDVSANSKNKY